MKIKDLTLEQFHNICIDHICHKCPLHSYNIEGFSMDFEGCLIRDIHVDTEEEFWKYEIRGFDVK